MQKKLKCCDNINNQMTWGSSPILILNKNTKNSLFIHPVLFQTAEDTLCRAEQEQAILLNKMRSAMADKDKTIEVFVQHG